MFWPVSRLDGDKGQKLSELQAMCDYENACMKFSNCLRNFWCDLLWVTAFRNIGINQVYNSVCNM